MTSTVGVRRAPLAAPAAPTRRRPVITPAAALSVIAVGALAVIGLWWQDTQFVYGLGGWLTNAGRITGLLAGYAVVVLLALMARVPALEHGVGSDRLARWHAMGGRYTVSLAVARADAAKKQSYLVDFVAPSLPSAPDRGFYITYLGYAFFGTLVLYAIGSLLAGAFRDQAGM